MHMKTGYQTECQEFSDLQRTETD